MSEVDFKRNLAIILKFAQRYENNDLWKFFIQNKHRCIDKWLHYFAVYDKWFKDYKNKEGVLHLLKLVFKMVAQYKCGKIILETR